MNNYYRIEILVRDVDDWVLTKEECEKISKSLIDRIDKLFGFDFYEDGRSGEVLSVTIEGGQINE